MPESIVNKVRLATLVEKESGTGVFISFFEIISDTFFIELPPGDYFWRYHYSEDIIRLQRYHYSALWGFSFWFIAFSWNCSWDVGILSPNKERRNSLPMEFICCSEGIHLSFYSLNKYRNNSLEFSDIFSLLSIT